MIHIYYGYGKGKTSSAIGAGMRAYGAGQSVLLVQFFKDNKSSELKSIPFDVFNAPDKILFNPGKSYQAWVDSAVEYIKKSNADFIILDEFVDLIGNFITVDQAIALLSNDKKEYVITGHKINEKLTNLADYVTHFEKQKHPFDNGISARLGIEF